ncbi:MAG: hypothetical protein DRI89_09250 [Bacteroidetes bacterium]|nr:MAG: hypothetical protein DRI89_09250 [Bacteroidota bacterium]
MQISNKFQNLISNIQIYCLEFDFSKIDIYLDFVFLGFDFPRFFMPWLIKINNIISVFNDS